MQVESTIDRGKSLTVQTVRGEVTAQEILDAIAAFYAGEPTRNILWDFSEAGPGSLTSDEIRSIAKATARGARQRVGGRTAFVFSSTFAYAMGRMFDQWVSASGAPVEYVSFRDRESALAWLEGAPAS